MKKLFRFFKKRIKNQNGNILATAFISMIVLSLSVASIAQITVNNYTAVNVKTEYLSNQALGEALIKQAIAEFEQYILDNMDFGMYNTNEIPRVLADYGITVTDVSGTTGYEDFGPASDSRAYRFAFPLDNGNTLVMYAFASSSGTIVENLNPFDFSMATNGTLLVNGGYMRDPALFGNDIRFGFRSAFINQFSSLPDTTPSDSGAYPDFNGNGSASDVYFTDSYTYCPGNCWDLGLTANDPFVLQESEYLDIEGSGLETGTINGDKIIADFFGTFYMGNEIIEYVSDVGPTGTDTITDPMTVSTIGAVVMANSDVPAENCTMVKIKGKWTEVCTLGASTEPYTDVTSEPTFDPSTLPTDIDYGGVYDGNLTINEDFIIQNYDTQGFVVTGDLTFSNTSDIVLEGYIVVLGDLYISGATLAVEGGFYVMGETFIEFDENEGLEANGANPDYSLSLLTMDNVFINSMWESHTSSVLPDEFDWLIYTEESIYCDCVNSRMNINGVFFAAARDNSGNYVPVEDENGDPVLGIFINSYRGYINAAGNAVPSGLTNRNSFYFDVVNEGNLQGSFLELPTFDTLVVEEGEYSFERSEFSYE